MTTDASYTVAPITSLPRVANLAENDLATVNELLGYLQKKSQRNALRDTYYDGKRLARTITEAVPPLYNELGLVLGWTQKAVDLLARRCTLERFTWADGDIDDTATRDIWDANELGAELPQALTASLIHSVSYLTVTYVKSEPALIHAKSARAATARRDGRTRKITAALAIDRTDAQGIATALTLYQPGVTTVIEGAGSKWEVTSRVEHIYGMPVFPLVYRPRLDRPFGSSRITRPMMSIQDQAVRELVRLEGHMDVFSFPELWMLGADLSIFDQEAWKVRMGRLKGVPDDDTLENPRIDLQQIQAASPEPHLAALNAFAKLFARESSLPDSSLAITDLANPTSAESYDAAQYDLIADAEGATDGWGPAINGAHRLALAMTEGKPVEDYATVRAKWRDARFLSRAAQADAGLKQIQAVPELATTDVGLELLGLDSHQIERVLGERRRNRSAQMLNDLTGTADQGSEGVAIKEKADALGVLIRAGADPEEAARAVGLVDLKFTGAVPVSLRLPEADATQLEEV